MRIILVRIKLPCRARRVHVLEIPVLPICRITPLLKVLALLLRLVINVQGLLSNATYNVDYGVAGFISEVSGRTSYALFEEWLEKICCGGQHSGKIQNVCR